MLYFELLSKVPLALKNEDIEKILARASKAFKSQNTEDRVISIVSVGPREMRKINLAARNKDEATDVLAFTLQDKDSFVSAPYVNDFFGEIIICPSVAARKGKARSMSKVQYQQLLLAHGVLHLFGLDHTKDIDAVKMERLEKKILN